MRLNPRVIDIDSSRNELQMAEQHGLVLGKDGLEIIRQTAGPKRRGFRVTKAEPQYIEQAGARYVFTEYGYVDPRKDKLEASRMLAAIRPGDRTELAYWTAAASDKMLTVHRGIGTLVIGSRGKSQVELIPLEPETAKEVTLPARSFYSIEADENAEGLLIVSGLYVPPVTDWEKLEVEIEPGQEYINTQAEGMIRVPNGFRERYEG